MYYSISKHLINRTLRPASLHTIINNFWGIWVMTWRKYLNYSTDYQAVPHVSSRNRTYSIHSNSKRIQWTKHNKQNIKICKRSDLIHVNKIKYQWRSYFWVQLEKMHEENVEKAELIFPEDKEIALNIEVLSFQLYLLMVTYHQ